MVSQTKIIFILKDKFNQIVLKTLIDKVKKWIKIKMWLIKLYRSKKKYKIFNKILKKIFKKILNKI